MNEAVLPLGPGVPTVAAHPDQPLSREKLGRLLAGLAVVIAGADVCFWKVQAMGFSVAVFILVLMATILANRTPPRWTRSTCWIVALMVGAVAANFIESGVTNLGVLIGLILVLAGHTFFADTASLWGRWLSQMVAMIRAPGRPFWLMGELVNTAFNKGLGPAGGLIGKLLLTLPALALALIFGGLLASGNEVFGSWTGSFFDWLGKELASFFDGARIALWVLVAFLALPLLRPVQVATWWWSWTERLPRLPEVIPTSGAIFCSSLILLVLNLLFLVANFADARFLWSSGALPQGVSYSSYVHNGVSILIVTVLLSAAVLATIFQQELKVAQQRGLKLLAYVWIFQNLFLLVSVALRLKLYIEAYDMTVERLSVLIFLVLVAAGYGLLALKIRHDKSLSWLVAGCAVAIFATFYITQFLNLEGWSADYNLARWEKYRAHPLDLAYLQDQGPAGWPALRRASDLGARWGNGESGLPIDSARIQEDACPRASFTSAHWREFSLRAWLNHGALDDKK